ncbi:MAG TPA: peptide ABC transporter ATP-binding protein [Clostridiaceae bacterium]|nr:peptide ABC transporter ATP-binding protein [Clostridiaceae bacterium]
MLLEVKDLVTQFKLKDGTFNAVDGMSFNIDNGEIVALVGESGCGKSVTSLSILGLIPNPPGKVIRGEILFKGKDILKKTRREMQNIRGNEISMIFQEPMTSLNPLFTIGKQITETLIRHKKMGREEAKERAVEMLDLVGIPSPGERFKNYPHQMSGGMRQRVMIAMALACNPELLIADEPTTALDVTIQAQILDLILRLKNKLNTAVLLITHDLGVVAEVADRVVVMYCGKVVESGSVKEIFAKPLHPYTEGLLLSIPKIDEKKEELFMIPGTVPNPLNMPAGCAFSTRCPKCMEKCIRKMPQLVKYSDRQIRCFMYGSDEGGRA